jgi:hypothetical protein
MTRCTKLRQRVRSGCGVSRFEQLADVVVEALLVQLQRHFVDGVLDVADFDDGLDGHVAKEGDLFTHVEVERMLGAAEDDVRGDTDLAQLGDALLRGLGLQLLRGLDVRDERGMDVEHIAGTDLVAELTDGFEERQALDVAHGAADFGDDDVAAHLLGHFVDARFDLVGDVRDDLHGAPLVFAGAFLVEHALVNLAGGEVVELGEVRVREALVVAEVEVGFRAVIEHIHFAVLVRVHRAGVDVQVRVKLLHDDLQAAQFEQGAEGGGGEAFAE